MAAIGNAYTHLFIVSQHKVSCSGKNAVHGSKTVGNEHGHMLEILPFNCDQEVISSRHEIKRFHLIELHDFFG